MLDNIKVVLPHPILFVELNVLGPARIVKRFL